MNSKKFTVFLSVLLLLLIILMLLRACSISRRNSSQTTVAQNTEIEKNIIEENIVSPTPEIIDDIVPVVDESVDIPEKSTVSKPVSKQVLKPKPAPKPKVSTQTKSSDVSSVDRSELPKSSFKRTKIKKETTPVFTNKSGFKPFYVYTDIGSKDNHYSPYGLMGDIRSLNIEQGCKVEPYSGKTCIRITYDSSKGNLSWAGTYWTEPPNNWGDKGYGFNLTGAERISFWARGEKGGEVINNFIMGGISGKELEDSDQVAIGPLTLSRDWKQYYIYIEGADLSNIIGGFCFTVTKHNNNADKIVFYLDDIVYE